MDELVNINMDKETISAMEELKDLLSLHSRELSEKENRFRSILESIPALIMVFDENERLIYATPKLEDLTGYSLMEIYKKGFKSKIITEDVHKYEESFKRQIWEKDTTLDFRFIDKKGNSNWVRGLFSHINAGNNKIFITLTLQDINKIKNAEIDSDLSNSFRNFFENHPDIVILHDSEGNIINLNKAAKEKLKYSKEELLGRNLSYLGLELKTSTENKENESPKLAVLTKIITKDGFGLNVKVEQCCVNDNDPILYMSIMKETSAFWLNKIENDHFERSISHIFQYLNLGFVFFDLEGKILRLSSNCEDLTGISLDNWNKSLPFLENLIKRVDFEIFKNHIGNALRGISIKDFVIEFGVQENQFRKIRAGLLSTTSETFNNCKVILTLQEFGPKNIEINNFYKLLVNSAPVGIITFDKEGRYTSVNEEFLKMLAYEYDRNTILSWNIHELADRDKILPGFVKALEGEFVGYIRDYMPIPSQQKFSFYQVFAPLKNEIGEIIGVLGLLNEITDTSIIPQNFLESEERYRRVFENLDDIYIIHNSSGKISTFNQKAMELLGYSSDEIARMNFMDFYSDKESEELEDRIFELQSFGNIEYSTDFICKDKTVKPVHIIGKGIEISGLQYFLEIIKILPINEEKENAKD